MFVLGLSKRDHCNNDHYDAAAAAVDVSQGSRKTQNAATAAGTDFVTCHNPMSKHFPGRHCCACQII
jgi:hypothetical protein